MGIWFDMSVFDGFQVDGSESFSGVSRRVWKNSASGFRDVVARTHIVPILKLMYHH